MKIMTIYFLFLFKNFHLEIRKNTNKKVVNKSRIIKIMNKKIIYTTCLFENDFEYK